MFSFGAITAACALLAPPELSFSAGKFTVKEGKTVLGVALPTTRPSRFEPLAKASFRKDDRFVVWDSRGLVVRIGQSSKHMPLDAWCTSPKLFDKSEIVRNRMALELGGYDPKVARLLAARRIGGKVFLVLGWLSPHGKDWFHAVGAVDLEAKSPAVSPLARLPGSFVADPQADAMPVVAGRIRIVWTGPSTWGICSVEPGGKAEVRSLGKELSDYSWTNENTISFLELSSSGKWQLGRFYVPTGNKRALVEVDIGARLIDSKSPWIALAREGDKLWVQNLDSASKVQVEPTSRAVRCGRFVIVWTGGQKPTRAWLYETSRWQRLAEWRASK